MSKKLSLISVLQAHQDVFHPVVAFNPDRDKLIELDFTPNNTELVPAILDDTKIFTDYINEKLKKAGAKFGIGGYGEHRTVYSRSNLFDGGTNSNGDLEEPRRLHLGVDIWGKPNSPVMAPLDGIVHSFAFNRNSGDYGVTIILTHNLSGVTFYTLYGHLSMNSIKNLQEGEMIKKGDVFSEFGIPMENGNWPPHLHFQVIIDLEGWKGDYPGVCRYSEKDAYLENCPDPDLILNLKEYLQQ